MKYITRHYGEGGKGVFVEPRKLFLGERMCEWKDTSDGTIHRSLKHFGATKVFGGVDDAGVPPL